MRKRSPVRFGLVAALSASVAVFGGCLGDGNPGELPPEVTEALEAAEDDLGEGISGLALETTVETIQGLLQWSQGNMGRDTARETSWNEAEQVWIISEEGPFEGPDVSGTAGTTYWVRFFAGETVQQVPDETTDRIDVRFEGFQRGNYHPGDFDVDFNLEAASHNVATKGELGAVDIVGDGELHGSSELHLADRTFLHTHVQTWENDFRIADGSDCVSGLLAGQLTVESDRASRRFTFQAEFDGQGNVSWTVWHGERVIVQETDAYACSGSRSGS